VALQLGQVLALNFYKAIIQYKGTHYSGFQIQVKEKTIAGELNSALSKITKSDQVKTIGSGRTDAGVHAFGQVVKIEIPFFIEADALMRAMNSHLPDDIRVKNVLVSDYDFHPIFHAKSKEYNYYFASNEYYSPHISELVTFIPPGFDLGLMKSAAFQFIGKHDFKNYQCVGTDVETTIREIFCCELDVFQSSGPWSQFLPEYYSFKVVGNGFLKQMVRLMVGATWNVGRRKVTLADLQHSLESPSIKKLGPTAPPEGLYLKEVHY
jgi:tRNA pseudouridine38-40 synthase